VSLSLEANSAGREGVLRGVIEASGSSILIIEH
jgi:hypothetical protein